jgi:hypothetical protein
MAWIPAVGLYPVRRKMQMGRRYCKSEEIDRKKKETAGILPFGQSGLALFFYGSRQFQMIPFTVFKFTDPIVTDLS